MTVGDLSTQRIIGHILCGISRRALRVGCLIAGLLLAMTSAIRAEHLPIKTYTIADGLANDVINRIVRDSHGYVWFCTKEGLSRFDGYTFTYYAKAQGLPGRDIFDLLETREGVYWVATDVGVYRFNPSGRVPVQSNSKTETEQSQSSKLGESSAEPVFIAYYLSREQKPYYATGLLEDHAGVIWCGTALGVYQLDRSGEQRIFRFVDMGMPMNFEEPYVQTLLEDRQGALWVGTTRSGLYRHLSDGHTERYTAQNGLPTNDIRALLEDREGHMWVGTRMGLCLLVSNPMPNQPIVARAFAKKDGLAADVMWSLFQSADGRLWVGMHGGLSSFVPANDGSASQISSFTTRNGLTDLDVWAIAQDREGNLWLASNGALKLAREGFTTYREDDGLASSAISSIFADQKGQVCTISSGITKKFINHFDGKRFSAVAPNLPGQINYAGWGWNQITFQDHTGEWWVTTGEGLVRFPKVSRIEQLAHTPPKAVYHTLGDMVVDEVFRLYEDRRGDIWISAYSGAPHPAKQWISRWERATETFHNYAPANGSPLVENWPLTTAFREDRAGNLWIGFNGPGLARLHDGRFTVFTTIDGLPAGWIKDLYLDHAGRLWIASNQEGLSRIDDPAAEHPRFINYRTDNGLASDNVWCTTEDEGHRIYVGTSRGVDRIDPESGHIRHYTQADGLAQNEVQVAFRDGHGSLWFGTTQGLSRFNPQPDKRPSSLPILISGVRVNGIAHHVSELGETEISKFVLGPYENEVQIDFVGLEFDAGQSLRYQYKFEGSDADWSAPTGGRSINFASLSSGEYRFSVRAVSADGVMSITPATVAFTILPPIWRRWWFVMLAAVAFGLAVYGGHRYRVARLVELARVRTRIATDLHDEIGSNLSLMAIVSDVANKRAGPKDSQMSEWLSLIAGTSRETMDAMADIVWVINPDKDRLLDLTLRMRRVADDIFTARNIAFQLSAPGDEADIKLGADTRHEVFMIFKESVNNIVRHSECTRADVEFKVEQGRLVLKLSDNGKGFEPAGAGDGNGLSSMRRRAKNLRGELVLISSAGIGTTVILQAPLDGQARSRR
jgi:ligand-binding sensor domain-containing protein